MSSKIIRNSLLLVFVLSYILTLLALFDVAVPFHHYYLYFATGSIFLIGYLIMVSKDIFR